METKISAKTSFKRLVWILNILINSYNMQLNLQGVLYTLVQFAKTYNLKINWSNYFKIINHSFSLINLDWNKDNVLLKLQELVKNELNLQNNNVRETTLVKFKAIILFCKILLQYNSLNETSITIF